MKWNINKTKLELIRWEEGDLKDVKLTRESQGANVEESLERLENELKFKEEMKSSLVLLINTFKGNDNQILKKKYVEGKSLECVAEELNYSSGYIRQKHAELRKRLDFLDDWEETKRKYGM